MFYTNFPRRCEKNRLNQIGPLHEIYLVKHALKHRHVLFVALVRMRKEKIRLVLEKGCFRNLFDAQNDVCLRNILSDNSARL